MPEVRAESSAGQSQPIKTATPRQADQRAWTRLPAEEGRESVEVTCNDGQKTPALVDNFSFAGAKLTMRGCGALAIGDSIQIVYSGAPMTGTVRFLEQADDATWRVGVEWMRRK